MLHRSTVAVAVAVASCVLSACSGNGKAATDATSSSAPAVQSTAAATPEQQSPTPTDAASASSAAVSSSASPAAESSSASPAAVASSASSAASSSSPPPARARAYTASQLKPALLRISDFPTGWKTIPVEDDDDDSKPIGDCAKKLDAFGDANPDSKAKVAANFENTAGGDEVEETVQGYPAAQAISADIAEFSDIVRNCKSLTMESDGEKITLTPGELSFPTFGDESVAFAMEGQFSGVNVVLNYVVVRRGTVLATFTQVGLGGLSAKELEGLVTKAVAKLDKQLASLPS